MWIDEEQNQNPELAKGSGFFKYTADSPFLWGLGLMAIEAFRYIPLTLLPTLRTGRRDLRSSINLPRRVNGPEIAAWFV